MTQRLIHLIEDDDDVARGLSFLLLTMGYQVKVYSSALKFVEELPKYPKGCVITDVHMPDLNGIELTAQLRSLGFSIPVIVISGHDDGSLGRLATRAGGVQFIAKPFDDEMLLEALEQVFMPTPADMPPPQ